MPHIRDWIDARHNEVWETGRTTLPPPFNHTMFIGRPINEYSSELRQSVNFPIQSGSSSFCAYQGYLTYRECQNQGIKMIPTAFIHDSIKAETYINNLFQFLEIIKYYYITYPYKTYGIPDGTDFEIGIGDFKKSSIEYSIENNIVTFDITFRDFHNDLILRDKMKELLPGFTILEEKEVNKKLIKLEDGFNSKTSYNLCMNKEVKLFKSKCQCEFIPFKNNFIL